MKRHDSPTYTLDDVETHLSSTTPLPRGFTFAGVRCGIKQGRADLGMIRSDRPAVGVGSFTTNPVRAPSVDRNGRLLPSSNIHAILINAGNANAMTGPRGAKDNEAMATHLAAALGVPADGVLTASTGMIGVPLQIELIAEAIPRVLDVASADPMPFAAAILTTDTCEKVAWAEVEVPGGDPVRILGVAKGSGMIHPNMATTLGYVVTDAAIDAEILLGMLRASIPDTFNGITVDGDTSTSDQVIVLANGASERKIEGEATARFAAALHAVIGSLARQVAADGEGATRLFEVEVTGAPSVEAARHVARGVCKSSLVKCSVFAGQADWGRIAAASGQAGLEHGIPIDQYKMTIRAQGLALYTPAGPVPEIKSSEVTRRLREPTVRWSVDLGLGEHRFLAFGCDLSYDYIRINADEAKQVQVTADGGVYRKWSLGAYAPEVKHQLLIDGLGYVRKFLGLRMLVNVPTGIDDRELGDTLGRDLSLCLDAGLRALVVVPSEAIAQQILEHATQWGHHATKVAPDPAAIGRLLDRGHLCVLIREEPVPAAIVDLAIKLGIQKLITFVDEPGLCDATGPVQRLSPETFLMGEERGRFDGAHADTLVLAKHAATRGIPALHLLDARVPHALVGELFTDEGIGTLITRQAM
jgi:acetylglutamate kinase